MKLIVTLSYQQSVDVQILIDGDLNNLEPIEELILDAGEHSINLPDNVIEDQIVVTLDGIDHILECDQDTLFINCYEPLYKENERI